MTNEEKEKTGSASTSTSFKSKKSVMSSQSNTVKENENEKLKEVAEFPNLKVSGDSPVDTELCAEVIDLDLSENDIEVQGNGIGETNKYDFIQKNKDNIQKKKSNAEKEKDSVLDKATSDWICDECNAQNFAKLLSGLLRLKCFKCQSPRGSSTQLVLSVAEVIRFVMISFTCRLYDVLSNHFVCNFVCTHQMGVILFYVTSMLRSIFVRVIAFVITLASVFPRCYTFFVFNHSSLHFEIPILLPVRFHFIFFYFFYLMHFDAGPILACAASTTPAIINTRISTVLHLKNMNILIYLFRWTR